MHLWVDLFDDHKSLPHCGGGAKAPGAAKHNKEKQKCSSHRRNNIEVKVHLLSVRATNNNNTTMARSSAQTQQLIVLGLASAVAVGLLVWKLSSSSSKQKAKQPSKNDNNDDLNDDDTAPTQTTADRSLPTSATTTTPTKKKKGSKSKQQQDTDATPKRTNKTLSNADMNTKIEELDKKGKAFFKDKQVRCAVLCFLLLHSIVVSNPSQSFSSS